MSKCHACQIDAVMAAGLTPSPADIRKWAMWGCTCTPAQAEAATAYIGAVSR